MTIEVHGTIRIVSLVHNVALCKLVHHFGGRSVLRSTHTSIRIITLHVSRCVAVFPVTLPTLDTPP